MKQLHLIIALLFVSTAIAQDGGPRAYECRNNTDVLESAMVSTEDVSAVKDSIETKSGKSEGVIHVCLESDPAFPGGQAAMLKFISEQLRYPSEAMKMGIQGKVTVQFEISETGSVGQIRVARGKDPDLDKEAVRVIRLLPNFIPATFNGKPVKVWYTLPITFKLPEKTAGAEDGSRSAVED